MIKVSDLTARPEMYAIGYRGQTKEQLKADLAYRREMLSYVKPQPRLKCVGEDSTGLFFVEVEGT